MDDRTEKITQLDLLKLRIPYEENLFGDEGIYEDVLIRLLDDSKYLGLSIRYPYQDFEGLELPNKYKNWQLRCCEELYNGIGTQGIKSYAENGLSWTRDSGYVSYELRNEIESMIGYINPSENIETGE